MRGLVLGVVAAAALTMPVAAAEAVLVGEYTWRDRDPSFGGISGFRLGPDGVTFRVVEDIGFTFTGKLTRGADGAVMGVARGPITRLTGEDGKPVGEDDWDAEGLATGPGGSFFVSFERNDRILRYADEGAVPVSLTKRWDLSWITYNKGFEALAADAKGRLYTAPESPRGAFHPVFRREGNSWVRVARIPAKGTWRVTDADFGPDGRLYVLERDFWGLIGFRTRILRLSFPAKGEPAIETLLETQAGTHDNLEGIAVWRDGSGAIRLTMVSDDNLNLFQKTELVDYRVVE
jgi:hypothetical protein